jgi:hypothetical protein
MGGQYHKAVSLTMRQQRFKITLAKVAAEIKSPNPFWSHVG